MENARGLAAMPDHPEMNETSLERMRKVLPLGFVIGTAFILPAVTRYENSFYRFLTLCIFLIGAFAHVVLNWEAVKRYFFFALLTAILPVLVTLPYSKNSVYLLLDRLPILVMAIGILIEEFSRLFERFMPVPRSVPPGVGPKLDEDKIRPILDRDKQLFAHMGGGGREPYNTPSQVSSDICLSNVGPGKLPSSCDTQTRTFWPDALDKHKENEGYETDAEISN